MAPERILSFILIVLHYEYPRHACFTISKRVCVISIAIQSRYE